MKAFWFFFSITGDTMEPAFNYPKLCMVLPHAYKTDNEQMKIALINALSSSLEYLTSDSFQQEFAEKPDTVGTQVDMYASLLEKTCDSFSTELKTAIKGATDEQLKPAVDLLRVAYGQCALIEQIGVEFEGDMFPLLVAYTMERCKMEGLETPQEIKKKAGAFMDEFYDKIKMNNEELRVATKFALNFA
jgi:hypothetical protein